MKSICAEIVCTVEKGQVKMAKKRRVYMECTEKNSWSLTEKVKGRRGRKEARGKGKRRE